jgi:ankyrin repeat protein
MFARAVVISFISLTLLVIHKQSKHSEIKKIMTGQSKLHSDHARKSNKGGTFSLDNIRGPSGIVSLESVSKFFNQSSIDTVDSESGQTLLEYACRTSEVSLAKYCFRKGAVLTNLTATGESLVNIVIENKRYDLMEFLLIYGIPVNFGDSSGRTALHTAAIRRDVEAICRIVELGADINVRDKSGRTPLHAAAISGDLPTVELLLELGARLNESDSKGFTAVSHAEINDHSSLMDRLITLGGHGHRLGQVPRHYGLDESPIKTVKTIPLGPQFSLNSDIPGFLVRLGKFNAPPRRKTQTT